MGNKEHSRSLALRKNTTALTSNMVTKEDEMVAAESRKPKVPVRVRFGYSNLIILQLPNFFMCEQ